jgi:glycosyltransferase involved in cell wall biosynthesis
VTRLRILTICHGHPALVPGGTETVAHDLFVAMRDDDRIQPLFLGCVSALHRQDRPGTGLQTIGRSADELLLWVGDVDPFLVGHNDPEAFAATFGRVLTAFRPHVVHIHHFSRIGLEALAVVRRLLPRARIVATLHDYHLLCANDGLMTMTGSGRLCRGSSPDACHGCFPSIPQRLFAARQVHVRTLLGLVDRFVAPSRFLSERFIAAGLPAGAIQIIPNGLPEPTPRPALEDGERTRQRFGFFGNIAPHKGVLVALAAAQRLGERLPEAEFRLSGGINFQPDAFRRAFADALDAARPIASDAGPYQREELPQRLAKVDWVVVPSTWWENQPLVILEAFQHRRPVICSDAGGMAELVQDGVTGLHARLGDADDLSRVMFRAATEPGLWHRLAAAAPRVPTVREILDRHLYLYAALLHDQEALSA